MVRTYGTSEGLQNTEIPVVYVLAATLLGKQPIYMAKCFKLPCLVLVNGTNPHGANILHFVSSLLRTSVDYVQLRSDDTLTDATL